jgi:hypothetical protein
MLRNPYDEDLFEYYATSQLALMDAASDKAKPIGPSGVIASARMGGRARNQSDRDGYWTSTDSEAAAASRCRSASSFRFSSAALWRAAISSSARRFASIRTWE